MTSSLAKSKQVIAAHF